MTTPHDSLRMGRAREQLGHTHDPLLKRGNAALDYWQRMPADRKESARMILVATGLTFGCCVSYVVMILFWFLVYYRSFTSTVGCLVGLLFASALMMLLSSDRVVKKSRPWLFWLGVLLLEATVLGLLVGFSCYFGNLVYFYRYQDMRAYSNVGASQSANNFHDGSMLLFTEDTRLDPLRSVGFASQWTGQTYCAAPIVDSTMSNENDIFYWAIGENCCLPRGSFECDDAFDALTRSALIILEPEDIVRPYMRWAVSGSTYPRYERAIRLQEAAYFTKAARQLKLVRWSRDPVALKNAYYHDAVSSCIWQSVLVFLLLAAQAAWFTTSFIFGVVGLRKGFPWRHKA